MGSSTDLIVQVIEYVPQHDKRQMVLDLLQTLEKVSASEMLLSCVKMTRMVPDIAGLAPVLSGAQGAGLGLQHS